MRGLILLLIALLPGVAFAQEGFLGLVGGKTATNLPNELNHFGALAGAFFQADLSPHLGIRSEASWTRSGALPREDISPCDDCVSEPTPVELDYAELNVMGRLAWATTQLQPLDSRLGFTVFAGGWLGARLHGKVAGGNNGIGDFGHLLGLGIFWKHHGFMMDVSARSYHGEAELTPGGPKRRGSQLVLGLGYRIHPRGTP